MPRRNDAVSRTNYPLIGGIIVLAAIAVVVAIVVSSGGHRTVPVIQVQDTVPSSSTTTPTSTPTITAPTIASSAVQEVLGQYEAETTPMRASKG